MMDAQLDDDLHEYLKLIDATVSKQSPSKSASCLDSQSHQTCQHVPAFKCPDSDLSQKQLLQAKSVSNLKAHVQSKMRLDDSYSDTNAGSNLTTLESPKQNDDPRDSFSRSEYHTLFGQPTPRHVTNLISNDNHIQTSAFQQYLPEIALNNNNNSQQITPSNCLCNLSQQSSKPSRTIGFQTTHLESFDALIGELKQLGDIHTIDKHQLSTCNYAIVSVFDVSSARKMFSFLSKLRGVFQVSFLMDSSDVRFADTLFISNSKLFNQNYVVEYMLQFGKVIECLLENNRLIVRFFDLRSLRKVQLFQQQFLSDRTAFFAQHRYLFPSYEDVFVFQLMKNIQVPSCSEIAQQPSNKSSASFMCSSQLLSQQQPSCVSAPFPTNSYPSTSKPSVIPQKIDDVEQQQPFESNFYINQQQFQTPNPLSYYPLSQKNSNNPFANNFSESCQYSSNTNQQLLNYGFRKQLKDISNIYNPHKQAFIQSVFEKTEIKATNKESPVTSPFSFEEPEVTSHVNETLPHSPSASSNLFTALISRNGQAFDGQTILQKYLVRPENASFAHPQQQQPSYALGQFQQQPNMFYQAPTSNFQKQDYQYQQTIEQLFQQQQQQQQQQLNKIEYSSLSMKKQRSANQNGNTKQDNQVDLNKISTGKDQRSTIMMRNIPNRYNQQELIKIIDIKFRGCYDFVYLPMDFQNRCNIGYAFINFIDPKHIIHFYEFFNAHKWDTIRSEKICQICYARLQGRNELISHFKRSGVMTALVDDSFKPLILPTPPQFSNSTNIN